RGVGAHRSLRSFPTRRSSDLMGALQERIASTSRGAITSVQAVYVPADDPTDPAPATAFGQLDAFLYLERAISEKGIYPAVDPLADRKSTRLNSSHVEISYAVF